MYVTFRFLKEQIVSFIVITRPSGHEAIKCNATIETVPRRHVSDIFRRRAFSSIYGCLRAPAYNFEFTVYWSTAKFVFDRGRLGVTVVSVQRKTIRNVRTRLNEIILCGSRGEAFTRTARYFVRKRVLIEIYYFVKTLSVCVRKPPSR